MGIKARFAPGETTIKTNPLHQWDYGQTLEIESADLPPVIEVHFACPKMSEAVISVCSVTNGACSVKIPDECLEQTNTITAWIYEIVGTTGTTTKTITIPIVARVRPARSETIQQTISDRYTELITEVSETIDKLESGEVIVGKATLATKADSAIAAENASTATYATSANSASILHPTAVQITNAVANPIQETGLYIVTGHLASGVYVTTLMPIVDLTADVQMQIDADFSLKYVASEQKLRFVTTGSYGGSNVFTKIYRLAGI